MNDDILGRFQTDEDIIMSDCGCLMVVADGMGGMNAGEIASALAIETVKDYFAPGKITPTMAESPVERRKYLELVIKEADRRIKTDAKSNSLHEGMGSTIILAWIVGDKMTLSWCGDSRAYRYNPLNGLEPLSRDHSYVQELVNKGALSYEDTFEHPQGNIVTRSLGDPNNAAKPETRQFEVYNEDIILLCSDGLSGVLRDRKTRDHNGSYYPGENIEDIIAAHTASMTECRDALLEAAEKADWYDNVTVLLCQIESGAGKVPKRQLVLHDNQSDHGNAKGIKSQRTKMYVGIGCLLVLMAVLCGVFYYMGAKDGEGRERAMVVENGQSGSNAEANVVEGEAIKEQPVAHNRNKKEEKTQPKKEADKKTDKKEEKLSASEQANTVLTPTWKSNLLKRLNNCSQQALKSIVVSVRKTIEDSGDAENDQKKCKKEVTKVEDRALCLKKLSAYNGMLTKEGEKKFKDVLGQIQDSKVYDPENWNKTIDNLKNYLKSDGGDQNQEELTPQPLPGRSDGGQRTAAHINEI
ncbi:MAG: protein phosphatase 2C domain-containing protein [Bacteroidales bacterium]|nr:protein phosphatase 2C domain-containing protein [Bacteroidales bacterium]